MLGGVCMMGNKPLLLVVRRRCGCVALACKKEVASLCAGEIGGLVAAGCRAEWMDDSAWRPLGMHTCADCEAIARGAKR